LSLVKKQQLRPSASTTLSPTSASHLYLNLMNNDDDLKLTRWLELAR
ncbi:hypothetical protein T01_13469, partial [Trichinella spiralis]